MLTEGGNMSGQLTPMMRHYLDTKEKYSDCVLFYRLGDFYEMFFEDAVTVSRELQLTLTGKACGLEERAPMCGVPHHAAEHYIRRLVEKGYKVAICEQLEDPAKAKGIVKRDVVRIVTPGTLTDSSMLSADVNNYLASIHMGKEEAGLAYCDISTGELAVSSFTVKDGFRELLDELIRLDVREALVNPQDAEKFTAELREQSEACVTELPENYFAADHANRVICRHFHVRSVTGLGIDEGSSVERALGALFSYLLETQKAGSSQLTSVRIEDHRGHCVLDQTAIRNLELMETITDQKKEGSLVSVLDCTRTAMGSRLLKKWIREVLSDSVEINERLDAVSVLAEDFLLRNNLRDCLKNVYDLERLSGRLAQGGANARDMIALRNSLRLLPEIRTELSDSPAALLKKASEKIDSLDRVCDEITAAIVEEPPVQIKEGGLIREGYSEQLDRLKADAKDSLEWIAGLEGRERERTGIKKLKLGYNKVFGYYLDVPKSFKGEIPEDYIRKQTLVNSERYVTNELKQMETIVLNAEANIHEMEYQVFSGLRERVAEYVPQMQQTAGAVALVDVLACLAQTAEENAYVRPVVDNGDVIEITGGRHPVIERKMDGEPFVSNDVYMDRKNSSMLLITGPNMSGKSTYMRQTALIVLMAQIGSFVPADAARIGTVDRIFTRIGASDNIARGQSTFYVEMSELAYILNTATPRSLIILDEIGRGTSTYDGLSIAWAAVDFLCRKDRRVRTMFATHYHELTELGDQVQEIRNLNVAVSEADGEVVFLHKIEEGGASRSYGIHVAKIAGVPDEVLRDASRKLAELEEKHPQVQTLLYPDVSYAEHESSREEAGAAEETEQISFLQFSNHPVVERIRSLDLMNLTPSGAIAILEEMKEAVKDLDRE